MTFTLVGPRGSDVPTAVIGESWRAGGAHDPSEVPLLRFPAPTREGAVNEFHRIRAIGIAAARAQKHGVGARGGPWRMKGSPYYLDNQAERLGLPMVTVRNPRVHENKQLHKISDLLGQLQRQYFAAPRLGEERQFTPPQLIAIRSVLVECDGEVSKLHAMAGASDEMVAEAYEAFGVDRPIRDFAVIAASDSPAESIEDAQPPAITDEALASLQAELANVADRYPENGELSRVLTARPVGLEQITAMFGTIRDEAARSTADVERLRAEIAGLSERPTLVAREHVPSNSPPRHDHRREKPANQR